jgi:hypothetical protein
MEKEISEYYQYNTLDFDSEGNRLEDGLSFRELIKKFERDFHSRHPSDYALNLYANSKTMSLLAKSCNAEPNMIYGMDLTRGDVFDSIVDPYVNFEMDQKSKYVYVYGIDSAYMTQCNEYGYPIFGDENNIWPLTLLVNDMMRDDEIRLSFPSDESDEKEDIIVEVPQIEFA